jgi:hypothetical protein
MYCDECFEVGPTIDFRCEDCRERYEAAVASDEEYELLGMAEALLDYPMEVA